MSLSEYVYTLIEDRERQLNTVIPGVVIAVRDNTGCYVDVQPTINLLATDGGSFERPPIMNVPLVFPMSTTGGLQFEINPGDPVLLVYSQRGLDTWKNSNGKPSVPIDMRRLDPRDCIAIPGLFPKPITPTDPAKHNYSHSKNDVVLVHNLGKANEVEIRLKKNGDVLIKSPGQVKVECGTAQVDATKTTINSVTEINGVTTINGNTAINGTLVVSQSVSAPTIAAASALTIGGLEMGTHKHSGVDAGSGTSGGPVGG